MLTNVDLAIKESTPDLDFIRLNEKYFNKVQSISIDNAIFEKTDKSFVKPANINWNDLGTYNALWETAKKDKNNNYIKGDVITNNVDSSYIYSDKSLIAVSDLSNINIVATQDAILVTKLNTPPLHFLSPGNQFCTVEYLISASSKATSSTFAACN